MPHVLIVDNDSDYTTRLAQVVAREGFSVGVAGTLAEAQQKMAERSPDVVLLDLTLPDGKGSELFSYLQSQSNTEFVVITEHPSLDTSIEALRMGAMDYLTKPINIKQVQGILSRIARPSDLKAEITQLRGVLRDLGRFGRLLGVSAGMQRVYDQVARVAPTAATVLIIGESGTGKEMVAQTVHELSRRRKQVFMPVNCSAISPQLIESELFGHEKGSFTGATRDRKGYFEQANGGTFFLDEITEMPFDLQAKLLRVLETGTFIPVGSNQPVEADVRIIAATNIFPEEAVAQGKLREDLLYRLQVFPIHLPPLRERIEDIDLLADHFLSELNRVEGTRKYLTLDARAQLRCNPWPGNVRELKNAIHRAFIMADEAIDAHCFLTGPDTPRTPLRNPFERIEAGMKIKDVERTLILKTLQYCDGNKEKTAEMLGISVKTLYNRLRELNQQPS